MTLNGKSMTEQAHSILVDYHKVNIFQDDVCVLNNVNFHAEEGEFIYIIGKVGSGKSSLLKTIYCELEINEAESAMVLGRDIMSIRRKEIPSLRKELGIIFQDFQLLHDRTVYKREEEGERKGGKKERREKRKKRREGEKEKKRPYR